MAQLRQNYPKFVDQDTEILVVGPDSPKAFRDYWRKHHLPFIGLPDPEHTVLKSYGQEIKLFKFGRMPAQIVIDVSGIVRYVHYGNSMSDIPSSGAILDTLKSMDR